MKICFLSGPNKPGKCGISDYINLLISEFKNYKSECEHFAINKERTLSDIAHNLPDADIYSFQFAPYAFSPTGLSTKALSDLAKSLKGRNTHVNFHEIWIGAYPNATWKEKIVGWRQKKEIQNFIKIATPNAVTCSNAAVIDRLNNTGSYANYLYLCGGIPYAENNEKRCSKVLQIVFFGTLYETFPYDILAKIIIQISSFLKKSVQINVLGRTRENTGFNKLMHVSQKYGLNISTLGELPSDVISKEFQMSDIGICTTPYDIIGKSSTTATMLEHRLPVLAFDDGDTPKNKLFVMSEFIDQIFLLNEDSTADRMISFLEKPRKSFFDGVAYTAKKMLDIVS